MKEVSIISVDLAKQVFQLHGATAEGEVVFRKRLSRKQFLVTCSPECPRSEVSSVQGLVLC